MLCFHGELRSQPQATTSAAVTVARGTAHTQHMPVSLLRL